MIDRRRFVGVLSPGRPLLAAEPPPETTRIRTIRELKGATIAITQERDDRHAFIASILTHVGLDPRTDVN